MIKVSKETLDGLNDLILAGKLSAKERGDQMWEENPELLEEVKK